MQGCWKALKPGDLVDVVAPGMKPKGVSLPRVKKFLESWNLQVRMDRDLIGSDLVCSHTREYRLNSLKKAIRSKDSAMVWCLRGGYGSLHLLPGLRRMKSPRVKIFLGFSDITLLHTFFHQNWNWKTLHGSHLDRFIKGDVGALEEKEYEKILFGQKSHVTYPLWPLNVQARKKTSLSGPIIGGNLTTLQSCFGTSYQIQLVGKILFLEEIGERAYRVDRILEHMGLLQIFRGIKALILGPFLGGEEPGGGSKLPTFLKLWAGKQKFPVFKGIPSGHEKKRQRLLPLGSVAEIRWSERPQIVIPTGVHL